MAQPLGGTSTFALDLVWASEIAGARAMTIAQAAAANRPPLTKRVRMILASPDIEAHILTRPAGTGKRLDEGGKSPLLKRLYFGIFQRPGFLAGAGKSLYMGPR
jgi:hypothetical protein